MHVSTVVPPAAEPVSLEEAKRHLKEDGDERDADILRLIVTARQAVEAYTRRALVSQTLRARLDEFPAHGLVELPRAPLQSVTSVSYVDSGGEVQALGADRYDVWTDVEPGRVYLAYGARWPATRGRGAVTVEYVAGYPPQVVDGEEEGEPTVDLVANVPPPLRDAMLLIVGDLYANPEGSIIGTIRAENPYAKSLMLPYRVVGRY